MVGVLARRAVWIAAVAVGLLGVAITATAQPEHATVCHRTGSPVNPFVTIEPSVNGAFHGHLGHAGDVIPPFQWQGDTYSLNWPSDEVEIVGGVCTLRQPEEPEEPEEPPEVEPGPPVEEEPPFTG